MRRTASVILVLSLFFVAGLPALAGLPVQAMETPASLDPWKEWVLHGKSEQRCPAHFNDGTIRRCWWPSRLAMNVGATGGLFEQQVTVYAPSWVILPGDNTHWPESVSIGGEDRVPVVARDNRPCIRLEPGAYLIKGAFVWTALPEMLQVTPSAGIVSLTVDGRNVVEPDIDGNGRLRLHGKSSIARPGDAMTVTRFRLVEDDIPMRVINRILLQVSGRPREIRLASLLPEGATVMKIDSPLPVRMDHAGGLLVQASPGQWDIRVTVRMDGPVTTLSTAKDGDGDEIWSFKAFNDLRMVKVLGAPTVEPSRTRMPDEWKGFPAYQLKPGTTLSLEVIRRGDPDPAPDQLHLDRSWWLDFNGAGFTVHDRISGTLSRTWQLSMRATPCSWDGWPWTAAIS
jgi:hypothetical protein